jgi:hypothetical protein
VGPQDEAHSSRKVVNHYVGVGSGRAAFTGADKNGQGARRPAGHHVGVAVTDDDGLIQLDPQFPGGAPQQARLRLTAVAGGRGVRAMVGGVEPGALGGE